MVFTHAVPVETVFSDDAGANHTRVTPNPAKPELKGED
jgi:hypothetical protein